MGAHTAAPSRSRYVGAILTLLLTVVALTAAAAPTQARAPAAFPFTATAVVTYTMLPWYQLPPNAAVYAGRTRLVIQMAVRDARHFRVDMQTVRPTLDAGTLTVIVRGRSILTYDTRTETAAQSTLPVTLPASLPAAVRTQWRLGLLNELLGGAVLGGTVFGGVGPVLPAPSVPDFLAALHQQLTVRYPPEYPQSYARVVGRQAMLGQSADVVQYGPLEEADQVTGCSFTHPGRCIHHYTTSGREVLGIEPQHLLVLNASQQGLPRTHLTLSLPLNLTERMTSLSYGVGPSAVAMHFQPPVPVAHIKEWSVNGWGGVMSGNGALPALPAPFLALPAPPSDTPYSFGYQELENGPLQKVTQVNLLYDNGRHVSTYVHRGDAYTYIQERIQVHGLPQALQQGTPGRAGSCDVWTGTYPHHQQWLALARGRLSILVVSNALSQTGLIRYAATVICPAHAESSAASSITLGARYSTEARAAGVTRVGSEAATCNPQMPSTLGGCMAGSPYIVETQTGTAYGTPNLPVQHRTYGWIQFLNTGPTMPHLVVSMDTGGTWTTHHVRVSINTGTSTSSRWVHWLGPRVSPFLWDFGRFPAGAVATIRFTMRLKHDCSYSNNFWAFGRVTAAGTPALHSEVWDSSQGESGGCANVRA